MKPVSTLTGRETNITVFFTEIYSKPSLITKT